MTKAIIEARDIYYGVGRKEILKGVSIEVREGEALSIIGPNGAGKTTLLKCLNRILRPDEGEIRLADRRLSRYSQTAVARLVGYVPQADGRLAPFSVHEFVMMGRYPHLSPFSSVTSKDEQAVDSALEMTGMGDFAERRLATLSGGERQKVFIAAALAQEARILLLDEPTTFLDPHHQADIYNIIRRINKDGVTVVSITHDVNSAALSSDRIVALKEGQVVFVGSPEELMTESNLAMIYDKRFLFAAHPTKGTPLLVPEGAS
jgi:iron complex transport system ATP-binding protein